MFKIKTHDAYIIMKIYKESYIKEKEGLLQKTKSYQ